MPRSSLPSNKNDCGDSYIRRMWNLSEIKRDMQSAGEFGGVGESPKENDDVVFLGQVKKTKRSNGSGYNSGSKSNATKLGDYKTGEIQSSSTIEISDQADEIKDGIEKDSFPTSTSQLFTSSSEPLWSTIIRNVPILEIDLNQNASGESTVRIIRRLSRHRTKTRQKQRRDASTKNVPPYGNQSVVHDGKSDDYVELVDEKIQNTSVAIARNESLQDSKEAKNHESDTNSESRNDTKNQSLPPSTQNGRIFSKAMKEVFQSIATHSNINSQANINRKRRSGSCDSTIQQSREKVKKCEERDNRKWNAEAKKESEETNQVAKNYVDRRSAKEMRWNFYEKNTRHESTRYTGENHQRHAGKNYQRYGGESYRRYDGVYSRGYNGEKYQQYGGANYRQYNGENDRNYDGDKSQTFRSQPGFWIKNEHYSGDYRGGWKSWVQHSHIGERENSSNNHSYRRQNALSAKDRLGGYATNFTAHSYAASQTRSHCFVKYPDETNNSKTRTWHEHAETKHCAICNLFFSTVHSAILHFQQVHAKSLSVTISN